VGEQLSAMGAPEKLKSIAGTRLPEAGVCRDPDDDAQRCFLQAPRWYSSRPCRRSWARLAKNLYVLFLSRAH
jgi:hypothetical protein